MAIEHGTVEGYLNAQYRGERIPIFTVWNCIDGDVAIVIPSAAEWACAIEWLTAHLGRRVSVTGIITSRPEQRDDLIEPERDGIRLMGDGSMPSEPINITGGLASEDHVAMIRGE